MGVVPVSTPSFSLAHQKIHRRHRPIHLKAPPLDVATHNLGHRFSFVDDSKQKSNASDLVLTWSKPPTISRSLPVSTNSTSSAFAEPYIVTDQSITNRASARQNDTDHVLPVRRGGPAAARRLIGIRHHYSRKILKNIQS